MSQNGDSDDDKFPGPGQQTDDDLVRVMSDSRDVLIFSNTLKVQPISIEEEEQSYRDERFGSFAGTGNAPASTIGTAFPTVILSHLGPVRSQVDSGSKWLKRQQRILEEVAKAQQNYSKTLQKIVDHEKAKVKSEEVDETKEKVKRDKMKRMWNAQLALYGSLEKSSFSQSEQSKILNIELVQPLLEAWKDNQRRVKEIYKEAETILKALNIALQKVKKAKEKAEQTIATRDAAIVRERKEQESGKAKRSLFSRISDNFSGNVPQNETKVKAARQAYEEAIQTYNEAKLKWETEQLVEIQRQLELLERDRISIQKTMCLKLVELYNKQAQRMKAIADDFQGVVNQMDTELDIRTFVLEIERDYGPSHFPDPLVDEIVDWEALEVIHEDKHVFNMKLTDILKAQRAEYPDLKIPYVLPMLIEEIKKFDGFSKEGIFRISASVDKVNTAKKEIIAGKTPVFEDPFVVADLFKIFLRELPDALFGQSYDKCIELAKNEDASLEDYRDFYENALETTPECRAVLDFIWELMLEYTKPQYTDGSKMSLRNYAIVFSPSLMRPAKEDEGDWMNHIQNAPYETLFIHKLVQAIGKYDINPPAVQEKVVRPTASALKSLEDMQIKAMRSSMNPSQSPPSARKTMSPIVEAPEVVKLEDDEVISTGQVPPPKLVNANLVSGASPRPSTPADAARIVSVVSLVDEKEDVKGDGPDAPEEEQQ
eukprot:TRINITY_DN13283_c0_g2_i1.p1 TRINITY_DN13283_c0_g2~~TRINITY_DN13283_c0_g2_i1.p1  ORF type:complete len:740 (-),score=214.21 TRINITY_DN13283_c0_g2_i1:1132-3267(-)